MDITYKVVKPQDSLSEFVESFWMLSNQSDIAKEVVVLPDGRFDVFFSASTVEPFHVSFAGLSTEPSKGMLGPRSIIFAVSFKLLAIECIFKPHQAPALNEVSTLPSDFWGIDIADLKDFESFCQKVTLKIQSLLPQKVVDKKKQLFEMIYKAQGDITIHDIGDAVHWSSRQINRYFNQWFGMSLKTYCNILRYRASFTQIKEGKLYPDLNFTDQAHFIKEIKKYSGVTPKELNKNKDDRFIQFSTLPKK